MEVTGRDVFVVMAIGELDWVNVLVDRSVMGVSEYE